MLDFFLLSWYPQKRLLEPFIYCRCFVIDLWQNRATGLLQGHLMRSGLFSKAFHENDVKWLQWRHSLRGQCQVTEMKTPFIRSRAVTQTVGPIHPDLRIRERLEIKEWVFAAALALVEAGYYHNEMHSEQVLLLFLLLFLAAVFGTFQSVVIQASYSIETGVLWNAAKILQMGGFQTQVSS